MTAPLMSCRQQEIRDAAIAVATTLIATPFISPAYMMIRFRVSFYYYFRHIHAAADMPPLPCHLRYDYADAATLLRAIRDTCDACYAIYVVITLLIL